MDDNVQKTFSKVFPFIFNAMCLVQLCMDVESLRGRFLVLSLYVVVTAIQLRLVRDKPAVRLSPASETRYCPQCDMDVPQRSRHSSRSGYCIEKYDHYCGFFGVEIGKVNMRRYLIIQQLELLFLGISIVIFAEHIWREYYSQGNFLLCVTATLIFLAILSTAVMVRFPMTRGLSQWEAKEVKNGTLEYPVPQGRGYFDELWKWYSGH